MSFLIGESMTGGYGAADILNGCTFEDVIHYLNSSWS